MVNDSHFCKHLLNENEPLEYYLKDNPTLRRLNLEKGCEQPRTSSGRKRGRVVT